MIAFFQAKTKADMITPAITAIAKSCHTVIAETAINTKASALGMTLFAESLLGGYALKHSAAMEAVSAMRNSRRVAFENGAGKANDDLARAKLYTEFEAKCIWERDGTLRIGEVAKGVINGLKLSEKVFSDNFDIPDEPTIKKWIREAGKEGGLEIPNDAQRPGRPPRKK